jgi:Ferritin-like domain
MADVVRLELTDPEAILRGDGRNEGGLTRFELLRRAAFGGGALIGGGALLTRVPEAFAQGVTDVDILNLLHLNEALEVAFYSEAVARGGLSGRALTFARQLQENETVHRDVAREALGANARPLPGFEFGETTANNANFLTTALALENNDVAALNGSGPLLRSRALLAVAGQIVSVEGRQAAWIRRIVYGPEYDAPTEYPAPGPLDTGITPEQTRQAILATGFIRGEI